MVVAAFLAAGSRAIILRQIITVRLRRRQALGIGLTAVALAWFSSLFILPSSLNLGSGGPGSSLSVDAFFFFFFVLTWLIFFYWVDASALNARRFDPLLRDSLHWSAARKWVWGLVAIMLFIGVLINFVAVGLLGDLTNNSIANALNGITIFTIVGIPFVTGLILLPFATRRSRDPTMRQHFKWFGYFVGFLGLGTVGLLLENFTGVILPVWQIMWVVSGYWLYRSGSSLVVVSPFPSDTESGPPTQTMGA